MKIKADPSFLVTLVILFLTNDAKHIFFMLFCALCHEAGHLIMLKALKVRALCLEIGLFGGTVVLEKKLISYRKEALLALSGAGVNLISALIFFLVLRRGFNEDIFFLFLSNAFYALFNLLPLSTLDGGRALLALTACKMELYEAERLSLAVSRITLCLLGGFSIWLITVSAFNVSLFVLTLLLYAESTAFDSRIAVKPYRGTNSASKPHKPQRKPN